MSENKRGVLTPEELKALEDAAMEIEPAVELEEEFFTNDNYYADDVATLDREDYIRCKACDGTGIDPMGSETVDCAECDGSGTVIPEEDDSFALDEGYDEDFNDD